MGNQPSGEATAASPANNSNSPIPGVGNMPQSGAPSLASARQSGSVKSGMDNTGGFYSQKSHTTIKVLIRGGPGAGKTALFNALQGLEFVPDYIPTEQLQYGRLSWSPHSAVSALASAEFLQRSDTTGLHETTQFKINPQVETDMTINLELVDTVDTGRRQLIPTNKLPNRSTLPPNIDLIDGNYYLPPVDSTTVDVWRNASALLLCIDPYSLPTYHYAVNILNSIPQNLLEKGFVVVLCLVKRDLPPVDRAVSDHMLAMLTTGTSIKTLHVSNLNKYGLDKLRNYLLIPYLTNRALEYQRLSEVYRAEVQVVTKFMNQLIGDQDYYQYVHIDSHNTVEPAPGSEPKQSGGLYDDIRDEDDFLGAKKRGGAQELDDLDFDNFGPGKKNNKNKGRFDESDEEPVVTKPTKAKSGNQGLKMKHDGGIKTTTQTKSGGLDDFFGDGFGNGDQGDGDDDIIPVKKEKKKKKKTGANSAETEVPSPVVATKAKAKIAVPSFFDDDLDLEPQKPIKAAPLTQTQSALQRARNKKTQNQQNSNFSSNPGAGVSVGGGLDSFFGDNDDIAPVPKAATTEPLPIQIDPHLLRPSSSCDIDEEAELAFFDGDDANGHQNNQDDITQTEQDELAAFDEELAAFDEQTVEEIEQTEPIQQDDQVGQEQEQGQEQGQEQEQEQVQEQEQAQEQEQELEQEQEQEQPIEREPDLQEPMIEQSPTEGVALAEQFEPDQHNDDDKEDQNPQNEALDESEVQIIQTESETTLKQQSTVDSPSAENEHSDSQRFPTPDTTQQSLAPSSPPRSAPGFFDDVEDDMDSFIPIKSKAKSPKPTRTQQSLQSPPSNFFDDEVEDQAVPKSTSKSPTKSPTMSFGDFEDDDVVQAALPKKKVAKKQTALEKQMEQLKLEEEKKKNQPDTGFTFRAKSSSSFYE